MPRAARVIVVAYVTLAVCMCVLLAGAYWNVYRHDPWMTPRWTTYNMLYWDVKWLVSVIAPLPAVAGVVALFSRRFRRSWAMWGAVALLVLACFASIAFP